MGAIEDLIARVAQARQAQMEHGTSSGSGDRKATTWEDVGRTVSRYVPRQVGAAVDVWNLAHGGQYGKEPIMGSDWLLRKGEELGWVAPAPESAGGKAVEAISDFASPAGAAKKAAMVAKVGSWGPELVGALGAISAKQAKDIIKYTKANEGATFDPITGAFEKAGYAVARIPPASSIGNKAVPQKTIDINSPRAIKDLQEFVRQNEDLLADGGKVGTWYDSKTGNIVVDPSEIVGSRFRGVLEGNRRQQDAIFDLKRKTEVRGDPYPTPKYTNIDEQPSYSVNVPISEERTKWTPGRPTVRNAQRVTRPKIYDDPREILNDSARLITPEDPLLYELFNVHRPDLDVMAMQKQDPSIVNPLLYHPSRPPAHVADVTTKRNAQRLQDVIGLALEDPRYAGMPGWYVTDPLYQSLLEFMEPTAAAKFFLEHHLYASPMSAANTVNKEIAKGSFAQLLDAEGKGADFFNRAMLPAGMDHLAHTSAHGAGLINMMESGGQRFWKEFDASPKTPNYFMSKIGENWRMPTGDAHFVRATGLPDVRPMFKDRNTGLMIPDDTSIGKTEAYPVGEWFHSSVAEPLGITGNMGQPTLWGALASRTGVDTAIGAPYLELLATQIGKAATRQGVAPKEAFRRYATLQGRDKYLGQIDDELLRVLGLGSAAGAAGYYAYGE